jgi:hypothetical protein
MSLPLSTFTSEMEVRALLGVTSKELKDDQLALPIYRQLLSLDFADLNESLESDVESIAALPSKTALEQKLLNLVNVFSGYAIALHIFPTLEQLAPQKITDGKAEVQRQTQDLSILKQGLEAGKQRVQSRLLDTYGLINTEVSVTSSLILPTFILGSTLPNDPVTDA